MKDHTHSFPRSTFSTHNRRLIADFVPYVAHLSESVICGLEHVRLRSLHVPIRHVVARVDSIGVDAILNVAIWIHSDQDVTKRRGGRVRWQSESERSEKETARASARGGMRAVSGWMGVLMRGACLLYTAC